MPSTQNKGVQPRAPINGTVDAPHQPRAGAGRRPDVGWRGTREAYVDDPISFNPDHDADLDAGPPPPWSAEGRRRAVVAVTNFLDALGGPEKRCWSLVTIVVPTLWYGRGAITAGAFKTAKRQLLLEFKKTDLTVGVFVLDVVVRCRFGEKQGPVGVQLHFHGAVRIRFSDGGAQDKFRDALRPWAAGHRAIRFDRIDEAQGGLPGFLRYGLKDLRNPLKVFGKRIVPANDGWTGEMRRLVEASGIRPKDLVVLHGLRRHGQTVRVLDPEIRLVMEGPHLPFRTDLGRHRVLPSGCLAPIAARRRPVCQLRPPMIDEAEPGWRAIVARLQPRAHCPSRHLSPRPGVRN